MSPRTTALSLSPKAQGWLNSTTQPRVLQVYSPVINLANEVDELLSIVVPGVGNGPFSIVVETNSFAPLVDTDPSISIHPDQIRLGDLTISVDQPALWLPSPDWEALKSIDFSASAQLIEDILTQEASPDSVASLVVRANHGSQDLDRFQQAAQVGVRLLTTGLQGDDVAKLVSGVEKLAGLGVGLTPAGDDFLVGVMHGLWAARDPAAAAALCRVIVETALPRTNRLSAAWLKAAGEGEAGESWHSLLVGIQGGDEEQISGAIFRILPTGHTSGADALGGFLYILKMENGR